MNTRLPSGQEQEPQLRQRISSGSQDPDDHLALARILFSQHRGSEAVAVCNTALALPLTNLQKSKVSTELAWGYYGIGSRPEALEAARSALELLAGDAATPEALACQARVYSLIALCEWWTKESESKAKQAAKLALTCYERMIQEASDVESISEVYYDAAKLYNLLGNAAHGVVLCKKYLECDLEDKDRVAGLNLLADCFRCEGRMSDAESSLEQALILAKGDPILLSALHFSQGLLKRAENRSDEAQNSFLKALDMRQQDRTVAINPIFYTDLYWNLAEISYQAGKYGDAVPSLEKILTLHPHEDLDHRNAMLWIAYCYENMGESEKATTYLRKVLGMSTLSETERVNAMMAWARNMGKFHYARQQYKEAAAAFEEVLRYQSTEDPERYNTLHWLGHSYVGLNQYEAARNRYSQIVESPYSKEPVKKAASRALSDLLSRMS